MHEKKEHIMGAQSEKAFNHPIIKAFLYFTIGWFLASTIAFVYGQELPIEEKAIIQPIVDKFENKIEIKELKNEKGERIIKNKTYDYKIKIDNSNYFINKFEFNENQTCISTDINKIFCGTFLIEIAL